jgi:hypothetical protein
VIKHRREGVGPAVVASFLLILTALIAPCPLGAQDEPPEKETSARIFPPTLVVRPLLGGPYRIDIGGGPIWAKRDPPAGSGNLSPEADVAFGYRLPVYRFRDGRDGGPAVDLAIEAGLDARFALGHGYNGLINSDFRAGMPIGMRFDGSWEATFALVHVSSHLGDNILEISPSIELKRVSRNGVEATVLRRIRGGLRAYLGGVYNFATADTEEFAGRLGLNLDRMAGDPRWAWPMGSLDLELTDLTERLAADASVGIGIRTGSGALQVGLAAHLGPSSMGQFRTVDDDYFGLFLRVVTPVVAQSGLRR